MTFASLAILVPLISAPVLAGVSPFVNRRVGVVATGSAVAMLVLTVLTLTRSSERLILWFGGWHPRAGIGIGVSFAVDGIGGGLAVFVAGLAVVALILSVRLIVVESFLFDAAALIFVAAMVGFCLTGDLFNMFVYFELMSVAAYVLVGYEVRQRAPLEGAMTFAVTNTVGAILLLFGIALIYGRTGALNLAQIGTVLEHQPLQPVTLIAFGLIASGLFVKAAVVPFHLWTADAYAVAPTPVCILLAGCFSEMGLYGFARIYWTAFHGALAPHDAELRAILVALGTLTGLLGAVMATAQHHLKRMLAFTTIALVGMFLIGIGLLSGDGVAAAGVWIVGDGLVKASLFACAAVVQHRCRAVQEGKLHGAGRPVWPVGVMFVIGALVVAGLPPTGSFLGHSLTEDAALKAPGYDWVPTIMMIVTGLVGGALLRVALRVFFGWGHPAPIQGSQSDEDEEETESEASGEEAGTSPLVWVPALVLLGAAFIWGVFPGLLGGVGRAAATFVDTHGYARQVLHGVHTAIVPVHLDPPSLTDYGYALGSLAIAVAAAAIALVRDPTLPRPLARGLEGLRALHSGRPGDYVAWTTVGAAAISAAFAFALR